MYIVITISISTLQNRTHPERTMLIQVSPLVQQSFHLLKITSLTCIDKEVHVISQVSVFLICSIILYIYDTRFELTLLPLLHFTFWMWPLPLDKVCSIPLVHVETQSDLLEMVWCTVCASYKYDVTVQLTGTQVNTREREACALRRRNSRVATQELSRCHTGTRALCCRVYRFTWESVRVKYYYRVLVCSSRLLVCSEVCSLTFLAPCTFLGLTIHSVFLRQARTLSMLVGTHALVGSGLSGFLLCCHHSSSVISLFCSLLEASSSATTGKQKRQAMGRMSAGTRSRMIDSSCSLTFVAEKYKS